MSNYCTIIFADGAQVSSPSLSAAMRYTKKKGFKTVSVSAIRQYFDRHPDAEYYMPSHEYKILNYRR